MIRPNKILLGLIKMSGLILVQTVFKGYQQTQDQARHYDQAQQNFVRPDQNVRPDLGPNCLQRLSADNTMQIGKPDKMSGLIWIQTV